MFLVVVVIVTALLFDFTNGFHDTSIATGALRPRVAVASAQCFTGCAAVIVYGIYLIAPSVTDRHL
ncbi:hypothetical protein ACFOY4_43820 [Actinomadura syzygii]|uniref:Inorganic phosphate transporter n=1 Tax=Actinomadura syzygii TaxID=1427538 RepID=A0A5D0TMS6_9ACTN|nr:hypothetical protein [Actinomadura syzygii]TYC07408.1 hypothetical protein FXF65_42890 [Actinomadura syzygii]